VPYSQCRDCCAVQQSSPESPSGMDADRGVRSSGSSGAPFARRQPYLGVLPAVRADVDATFGCGLGGPLPVVTARATTAQPCATLSAALGILSMSRRLSGEMEGLSLAALGLGLGESEILVRAVAASEGRATMRELAVGSGFSQSGLSRIVDRLEARDLVHRRADCRDRRQMLIRVTASGVDVARQLLDLLEEGSRAALEREGVSGVLGAAMSRPPALEELGCCPHMRRAGASIDAPGPGRS